MAKAWMEDKGIWLFDLAHGKLTGDSIVRGFLKHYVLVGQGMDKVLQDLHFHTHYGDHYMKSVASSLRTGLENLIEKDTALAGDVGNEGMQVLG